MKVLNTTTQKQQIYYVDGSCETILPNETKKIKVSNVYTFEMDRIKNIFKIVEEKKNEHDIKINENKNVDAFSNKRKTFNSLSDNEEGGTK